MSSFLSDSVVQYVTSVTSPESDLERRLREETSRLPEGGMQSSADAGALLALLARLVGTRRALEVGTFTGFTALKVASVLPADGKLICCDVSREWTNIGRRYWGEAGVAERIDLRLAPAMDTLTSLARQCGAGTFDFAFIDADKPGYPAYFDMCVKLVRPGGVIVLDNMLWGGSVADPNSSRQDVDVIRALNQTITDDARVESCLVTVGDGLMVARKR